jgi:hypothetical protein
MGLHPFLRHQCAFCVTILASDELTRLGDEVRPGAPRQIGDERVERAVRLTLEVLR